MKRVIIAVFAALLLTGAALAQEIAVSGELRTGFYMEQEKIGSGDPIAEGGMTNTDGYSGSGQGLGRLDIGFTYNNLGLRTSFKIEPQGNGPFRPEWNYAYAYGNLLQDQLTISAGLLGDSSWGTGGTELRRNPETREYYLNRNLLSNDPYTAIEALMGIRFEIKPAVVPGLNVGVTFNQPDQKTGAETERTFGDVLSESVIGAAYEHDYFAVRLGYRFDGAADIYTTDNREEGGRLTYRLEERVLDNMVKGMKVWLNGIYYGIGCEKWQEDRTVGGKTMKIDLGSGEYSDNWLYWLWDTDSFTAQFDMRFAMYKAYRNNDFLIPLRQDYQALEFRPAFYYKFFDWLQAGLRFGFGMEFGNGKTYVDAPYQFFFVEPQLRFNLSNSAYLALVYNFTDKYVWFNDNEMSRRGEKSVKHAVNLRAVYTF